MTESSKTDRARPPLRAALIHLGGGGAGAAEIADALGWTRRRLREASDGRDGLAKPLERARDAELAWWEARARTGVAGRPSAALWGRAMAGRFSAEGYGRVVERAEAAAPPERDDLMRARAKAVLQLLAKVREAGERA